MRARTYILTVTAYGFLSVEVFRFPSVRSRRRRYEPRERFINFDLIVWC